MTNFIEAYQAANFYVLTAALLASTATLGGGISIFA
jgi:hypothetical protein